MAIACHRPAGAARAGLSALGLAALLGLAGGDGEGAHAGLCFRSDRFSQDGAPLGAGCFDLARIRSLDCPGPGCPAGALHFVSAAVDADGFELPPLPGYATASEGPLCTGIRDRMGAEEKLVLLGQVVSLDDLDKARRLALVMAETVGRDVARLCRIEAERILVVGADSVGVALAEEEVPVDGVALVVDPVLAGRLEELRSLLF